LKKKCCTAVFGSAVLELLAEKGISGVLVKRLGVTDEFCQACHPGRTTTKIRSFDEEGILLTIKKMLTK
jgi:deoxyxylulose-5-phosphate synthase